MNKNFSSEYGEIKIHKKVISRIAEITSKKVKGVSKVGLECYGLAGKILKLFGYRAIKIKISENQGIKVNIPIIVDYNSNLVEVASEVQRDVTYKLLNALNLDYLSVEVRIKNIEKGGK